MRKSFDEGLILSVLEQLSAFWEKDATLEYLLKRYQELNKYLEGTKK